MGSLFDGDEHFAGPQLVPTIVWRHSQATRLEIRGYDFSKLDYDGVAREQFEEDYTAWERDAAKFIAQHYGESERNRFVF